MEEEAKKTTVAEAAHAALVSDRVHTKENMVKVIEKKREMFLLQMNIDIKKEEIRKLEEYSHVREEGLKISEDMLEEDLKEFNKFWTRCKEDTHQAMKKAEDETKRKIKHTQKVGKLNDKKQAVFNATQKSEELLNEYMKYKLFLDKLTPKEWLDGQKEKYRRKMARKGRAPAQVTQLYTEEDLLYDSDSETPDMYFHDSRQLMEIFGDLVEENLFLIQNIQEQEQALEEAKHALRNYQRESDLKLEALRENQDRMQRGIEDKEQICEMLQARLDNSKQSESDEQPRLKELEEEIRKIYSSSGGEDGSIAMLTNIEQTIDEFLTLFNLVSKAKENSDYIASEGRKREKQRREDAHVKTRETENERAREKSQKYMDRARNPAKKQ